MKRILVTVLAACLAAAVLAACGGSPAPSSQPVVPSSVSASSPQPGGQSSQASQSAAEGTDAEAAQARADSLLPALAEAAALGNTIDVIELDLRAGGINTENILAFAGAESQTSAENGGIVLVLMAKAGQAEAVKTDLAAFRDARMGNEDYAEFENARANTGNARIVAGGDVVVYAVSAEGDAGWDRLDAAIDDALAG